MILSAHSDIMTVQNIKYEFLKYCYFISSASKTMSSRVPKKLQYIQQVFLFLFGQAFRDRRATKPQIQQINMATKSTVIDNQFFNKKKHSGSLKNSFYFFFVFWQSVAKIVILAPPFHLFNIGCKFAWSFLPTAAWHRFSRFGATLNQGEEGIMDIFEQA